MELVKRRELFAYQLLFDPDDQQNRFKAGFAAFPEGDDMARGMALEAATEWPTDPEMRLIMAELVAKHGEAHFLPSKGDLARELFKTVRGGKTHADRTQAAKVYAEVMGFIEKPAPVSVNQNNTQVTNKVMVVPMAPTNDDWEAKALKGQAKLFAEASS